MRDLFTLYKELFQDSNSWKYYSKLTINPFENNGMSKEFVKRFIELSGKDENNILYKEIDKLEPKRIKHIVSTFFLGTYLYFNIPSIRNPIDKILKRYQEQNLESTIRFSFLWFLICLFHDLGYNIEENNKYNSFDDFLIHNCSVPSYLNSRVGVPKVYFNTYKAYFNFRLTSNNQYFGGKPDHGICGGILLFDVLNKIINKRISNREPRETKGLYWDRKLLSIYKRVSWVILSHNIYFAWKGSDNYKDYKEDLKLQELILTKETGPLVKLSKHPFLFLFLLVDCIEPIKHFKDSSGFSKLDSVKLECSDNSMTIEFPAEIFNETFLANIKNLEWYLIPEITINDGVIKFNFENC